MSNKLGSQPERGVSVANGPRSSLRVTVPHGVVLGGTEEGVVEVGQDECQGVEICGRSRGGKQQR